VANKNEGRWIRGQRIKYGIACYKALIQVADDAALFGIVFGDGSGEFCISRYSLVLPIFAQFAPALMCIKKCTFLQCTFLARYFCCT